MTQTKKNAKEALEALAADLRKTARSGQPWTPRDRDRWEALWLVGRQAFHAIPPLPADDADTSSVQLRQLAGTYQSYARGWL